MYTFEEFQADVLRIAKTHGYKIEKLKDTGIPQIDFGNKKLHGKHFRVLFPRVLADGVNINKLIEEIAPGRPCSHLPFRKIVEQIKKERPDLPIIAVTAYAMDKDKTNSIEAGCDNYLSKPYKMEDLYSLIDTYIS